MIFTLPEGASIQAEEAETNDQPPLYDFSQKTLRTFIVTSEDGATQTKYLIRVNKLTLPTSYSFEELKEITPYNVFYLTNESGIMQWQAEIQDTT